MANEIHRKDLFYFVCKEPKAPWEAFLRSVTRRNDWLLQLVDYSLSFASFSLGWWGGWGIGCHLSPAQLFVAIAKMTLLYNVGVGWRRPGGAIWNPVPNEDGPLHSPGSPDLAKALTCTLTSLGSAAAPHKSTQAFVWLQVLEEKTETKADLGGPN